jgi:uncharacterized protein (DUF58 family)
MTARAGGAGLVAAGVVVAAWLVGSNALAVLGVGLGLAALVAGLWGRLVRRSLVVERERTAVPPVEGETLGLAVRARGRRWLASRLEWYDRVGPLGELVAAVDGSGVARIVVRGVPRGRYALGPGALVAVDPLGLSAVEVALDHEAVLLVRPRVPELDTLFTDSGVWGEGGRRAKLRHPSGLDPHGVRAYVEGEPLRSVHWPTSARRGELMVRDLEEAPRDAVAVVLDVDARSVVGPPGRSSLDDAVRVAAGIVRTHARRSREGLLVIAGPQPQLHQVRALGGEWESALDALAAVEGESGTRLPELVAPGGPLGALADLVVVTARPEVIADTLVARAAAGRRTAVVAVDGPTYTGRPASPASPALMRLGAAGVAVAVVREGTALGEAIGDLRVRAVG